MSHEAAANIFVIFLSLKLDEGSDIAYETEVAQTGRYERGLWSALKRYGRRWIGQKVDPVEYKRQRIEFEAQEEERITARVAQGVSTEPDLSDDSGGEESANWWKKPFFSWFSPLVSLGRRRPLLLHDLGTLHPSLSISKTSDLLESNWMEKRAKEREEQKYREKKSLTNGEIGRTDNMRNEYVELDELDDNRTKSNSKWGDKYSYRKGENREKEKFSESWEGKAILKTLMNTYGKDLGWITLLRMWRVTAGFTGPYIVKNLLQRVEDPAAHSMWYGLVWAMALFIDMYFAALMFQHFHHWSVQLELKIRNALIGLIFNKLLRLSSKSQQSAEVHATLMNLIGPETNRIAEMVWNLPIFVLAPCLTLVCFASICYLMSVFSALAGFAVLFVLVPLALLVAKKVETIKTAQLLCTDARMTIVTDVFHTMKTVKLFALENHLAENASQARKEDIKFLKKGARYSALAKTLFDGIIPIMYLVTVGTFVGRGGVLAPSNAFAIFSVFAALYWPFLFFTASFTASAEALVSLRRLESFLNLDEVEEQHEDEKNENFGQNQTFSSMEEDDESNHSSNDLTSDGKKKIIASSSISRSLGLAIHLQNATFSWDDEQIVLRSLNMEIQPYSLNCIVGPVGCGKSSLLQAILGEMKLKNGFSRVQRGGECIAYYAQLPFLTNTTIRENILFGLPFDPVRYAEVIAVCALQPDLNTLHLADLTIIGERGVTLSGGQKARISMARVAYSRAKIVLLDDPLSSLDAHVAHHLFHQCFRSFMKDRTILLVTHQLQYAAQSDHLFAFQENGTILASGAPSDALLSTITKESFVEFSKADNTSSSSEQATVGPSEISSIISNPISTNPDHLQTTSSLLTMKDDGSNLIYKEERSGLRIDSKILSFYFSRYVRWWFFALFLLLVFRAVTMWLHLYIGSVSSNNVIKVVGPQPIAPMPPQSSKISKNSSTRNFMIIFAVGSALVVITNYIRTIVLVTICLWTAKSIYEQMMERLFRAKMSFFEETPKGRITSRCSSDVSSIDNKIAEPLGTMATHATIAVAAFVFSGMAVGVVATMLLLPTLSFFYYVIFNRSIGALRDLTRLEGTGKSPVASLASETKHGLITLRAFQRTRKDMIAIQRKLLEGIARPSYYKSVATQWIATRMSFVSALMGLTFALLGVFMSSSLNPGYFAAALAAFLIASDMVSDFMKSYVSLETSFSSVHRLFQFSFVPIERSFDENQHTDHHSLINDENHIILDSPEGSRGLKNFMKNGSISFDHVSLRYRSGLPFALTDVSFNIKSGEKIGVVGRTGAGKSSLFAALLCLNETESGSITIDGVDVKDLDVGELRRNLAIIPQDPVLFRGTLRFNLDPFQRHPDASLWRVLQRVHLSNLIQTFPAQLDTHVSNESQSGLLSYGQRQLLCVARALLKDSKILLLDEASSAIDLDTDRLLQKTLSSEFSACTTITIAHRIETIMNSDRILVMHQSRVAEFDTPENLLANKNSIFYSLHQQGLVLNSAQSSTMNQDIPKIGNSTESLVD